MPKKRKKSRNDRPNHLRAVGNPPVTEAMTMRRFSAWYLDHSADVDGDPPESAMSAVLSDVLTRLVHLGGNGAIVRPNAAVLEELLNTIRADENAKQDAVAMLTALDHYLMFLDETGSWLGTEAEFEASADVVRDASTETPGILSTLVRGLSEVPDVPLPEQVRGLDALQPIAATDALLDWIGRSRNVTTSGALRLADIQVVAAMLGMRVVGERGARRPWEDVDVEAESLVVGSMWDVPEIAIWWNALLQSGIIETTATTVRPGPDADRWRLSDPAVAAQVRSGLLNLYISGWFAQEVDAGSLFGPLVVIRLLARLSAATNPDVLPDLSDEALDEVLDSAADLAGLPGLDFGGVVESRVHRTLGRLETDEVLTKATLSGGGTRYQVPAALRPAMARAVDAMGSTLSALSPGDASRGEMLPSEHPLGTALQLKVALVGTKPAVWRRVVVAADATLGHLHDVVQAAFGWDDSHLHQFSEEDWYGSEILYGSADSEQFLSENAEFVDEAVVPIGGLLVQPGDELFYLYDFGDDWRHVIRLESVQPDGADTAPRCTGGRGHSLVDDAGGAFGWEEMVRIAADPKDPEHEQTREWLGLEPGEQIDLGHFDREEVERALIPLRR